MRTVPLARHDAFHFGLLADAMDAERARVVNRAWVVVHEHAEEVVVLDLPLRIGNHLKFEALAEQVHSEGLE